MIPAKARLLNIKSILLETLSSASATPSRVATTRAPAVYYLAWRMRRNHPWQSAEFISQTEAQERYAKLIESGAEAYLEARKQRHAA